MIRSAAFLLSMPALIVAFAVAADAQPPSQAEADVRSLLFSLQPGNGSRVSYGPVYLIYSLANPADHPIRSSANLSTATGGVEIYVSADGKPPARLSPSLYVCSVGEKVIEHAPGEMIRGFLRMLMLDRSSSPAKLRPGTYSVSSRVFVGNNEAPIFLEAGPLDIVVTEPSALELRAISVLGTDTDLNRLLEEGPADYCTGRPSSDCVTFLREFAADFADTAFAPAVLMDLAESLHEGRIKTDQAQRLAAEMSEEFLDRWPDHPLVPEASLLAVRALASAGRADERKYIVERMEKKFPEQMTFLKRLRKISGMD